MAERPGDGLTEGEERLLDEVVVAATAYRVIGQKWRVILHAVGVEDLIDRKLTVKDLRVCANSAWFRSLPEFDVPKELAICANTYLEAEKRLDSAIAILKAELSLTHTPEELKELAASEDAE